MTQFKFTYVDFDKKNVTGTLEAQDRESALKILSEKSEYVTDLKEIKKHVFLFSQNVRNEELMIFTQQLATVIAAGVPFKRALDIIAGDIDNPFFKSIVMDISSGVAEGKPISEMLVKYPHIFSRLYQSMTEAGETGGKLPDILKRLAGYMENAEVMRNKVKAALFYPSAVIVISLLISVFIFLFGVKQFEGIYKGLNAQLPFITGFNWHS